MRFKISFLVLSCQLLIQSFCIGQDFQTQSVAVFKNGQSFFIKSGNVTTDNQIYKMLEKDIPPALFGSLWFDTPNHSIKGIKSYPDTLIRKHSSSDLLFRDLLSINRGKKLKVYLSENKTFEGTLEVVPTTKNATSSNRVLFTIQTTDGQWVSFYAAQVQQVEFLEKPTLVQASTEPLPQQVIEISFDQKQSKQQLDMMYLRNGLTWSPEYLLELKSPSKAQLTLQASIANDGEDLEDVTMNLVVGVPNFSYANRLSYIVDFIKDYVMPISSNQTQLTNTMMFDPNTYEATASAAPPTNELNAGSNEDFFFYPLEQFTLPKKGRAIERLFKEEIDITHIYESNLPPTTNYPSFNEDFFFSPNPNKVFHTIRVDNKTGQPWTTGTVFIVNDEGEKKPVSQDRLLYTSHGGHSFIKVTEATDIKIKHAEKEVSRIEQSRRFPKNSSFYDLVEIEGKLNIQNFKQESINLNVRRTINGLLESSSTPWLNQGAISINGSLNKSNKVCWEATVEAGETLEILYRYKMYIRS